MSFSGILLAFRRFAEAAAADTGRMMHREPWGPAHPSNVARFTERLRYAPFPMGSRDRDPHDSEAQPGTQVHVDGLDPGQMTARPGGSVPGTLAAPLTPRSTGPEPDYPSRRSNASTRRRQPATSYPMLRPTSPAGRQRRRLPGGFTPTRKTRRSRALLSVQPTGRAAILRLKRGVPSPGPPSAAHRCHVHCDGSPEACRAPVPCLPRA